MTLGIGLRLSLLSSTSLTAGVGGGGVVVPSPELRVAEITTMSGGRPAIVPQSYHDYVALDSNDANQHPHMGPFTHVAVKNGLWSDPTLWDVGAVPGANAVVNTSTFDVTYDLESDVLLKDIHVSGAGTLRWATDKDTRMWVDTIMNHGTLIMGEPGSPIPESATLGKPRAEVVFWASEAPLATVRLGLNTMGPVRIQGAVKKHWLRSPASILAGATSAILDDVAGSGWRVGDTIIFPATEKAGTTPTDPQYTGPTQFYGPFGNPAGVQTRTLGYRVPQDEERIITAIAGDTISWPDPLSFDHKVYSETLPRGQTAIMSPIVGNKSRSIVFRSAGGKAGDLAVWSGADLTVLQKRAHIMFMFDDDVQCRGARALDMARTDTNPSLVAPSAKLDLDTDAVTNFIAYDKPPSDPTRVAITDPNNVRGRYAFHVHGTGAYFGRKQVVIEDCVADTSPGAPPIPGWAMTHHNARASFERNVIHNIRGSGMVSEVGNEIGQWLDNLVCYVRGDGYPVAFGSRAEWWQNHNDHYGSGYGNQARQILMQGNHVTSAHKPYSYLQQDIAASIRQPDEFSLRMIDPIVRSDPTYPFAVMNPEQPQIPDFINNTFANCGDGLYVEHRLNKLDRFDETPMLLHGFHGVNSDRPFNIVNYTQHYYVFDTMWVGFEVAAQAGAVSGSFSFANMKLRNGNIGFNVGNNYGGFITDAQAVNVTNPFPDFTVAVNTANEDPTQHPFYNMMDQWVVTNNDSPSPGYTVRARTGRSLNSQTDLPQPYPLPPLGRQMPAGSPPVPFGSSPYFLLDEAASDLTAVAGGGFNQITVVGTLRDSVGDRRFGDYQNPETPFSNYSAKVGRISRQMTGEDIIRRNGCFNDNGVWKSRLWFIYADRATGEYYFPTVDITLTGFAPDFLAANTVDPMSTKPALPMKPEETRNTPYVRKTTPPAITSATAIDSSIGLKLAHQLKANEGQVKWTIVGGANAADLEINSVGGVRTLRYAGDGVRSTGATLAVVLRVTDQFGNFTEAAHTVNVAAQFKDDFNGENGQALEARPGWTLAYGAAASATVTSTGALRRAGTGGYMSLDLGSANHGIRARLTSTNSGSLIALRFTDANNLFGFRRNGAGLEAISVVGGTTNTLAGYSPSNLSSSDVISIELIGNDWTVKRNGVVVPPNFKNAYPAGLPSSTRQGLRVTGSVGDNWIDDYEAYLT